MTGLIGVLAVVVCVLLAVGICDVNRFVLREYEVVCPALREPYRFCMLSDLHNKEYGAGNRRLLQAIDVLEPQSILMAGDMVTSADRPNCEPALRLVSALSARYPVYYGIGNHERRMRGSPDSLRNGYQAYEEELARTGVRVLSNESCPLPGTNLRIYGLDLPKQYYRKWKPYPMEKKTLEQLLGVVKQDEVSVLLAHNPDYFPVYAAWGADVVLAGHVHGGIVRLPLVGGVLAPTLRLFPKYDGGVFREGDSTMILGRGLGTHTLPIRLFNPGELILVRLVPAAPVK